MLTVKQDVYFSWKTLYEIKITLWNSVKRNKGPRLPPSIPNDKVPTGGERETEMEGEREKEVEKRGAVILLNMCGYFFVIQGTHAPFSHIVSLAILCDSCLVLSLSPSSLTLCRPFAMRPREVKSCQICALGGGTNSHTPQGTACLFSLALSHTFLCSLSALRFFFCFYSVQISHEWPQPRDKNKLGGVFSFL